MLKSLFKPKWQNADVNARRQALESLDAVADVEIIKSIASDDPSEKIREQAIFKLTDPVVLCEFLDKCRILEHWLPLAVKIDQISPQTDRLASAFANLKSDWKIDEVINQIAACQYLPLAEKLLSVVVGDAPHALFVIATRAKSIEFRLKIVQQIDDFDLLQQLSKKATNKNVLHVVRAKLKQVKQTQLAIKESQDSAERLIESIAKLSTQTWFDTQYEARVNNVLLHWQELDLVLVENSNFLEKQFHQLLNICQKIILGYQKEIEQTAMVQDAINKQQEICIQLEKLVMETSESALQSDSSLQSVKNAVQILDENWQQSILIVKADKKIEQQYQQWKTNINDSFANWKKFFELGPEFEAIINIEPKSEYFKLKDWLSNWNELLQKLQWPKDITVPQLFSEWENKSNAIQAQFDAIISQQKKKSKVLNQKLNVLQSHCQQRNLIAANKLDNYIEIKSQELVGSFQDNFKSKLERVQPKLDELRDWHNFATSPKKESLCEEMERLIKETHEPLEIARKVRELQLQWRELNASDANADDELWERFKQASDAAYEPCLIFYAEKDKVRADNLNHCLNICNDMEKLINENGWNTSKSVQTEQSTLAAKTNSKNINWKGLENILQKLEQRWKKYHPVPENEYQSIKNHYTLAYRTINKKIKEEKQNNLDARCKLVDKAISLADLDDTKQSIAEAIKLQTIWKNIGPTFFKADRKQWKLFRSALDRVFEKRDRINQQNKQDQLENQRKLIEVTQQINQLTGLVDKELEDSYLQYQDLQKSWSLDYELPKTSGRKAILAFEKSCQRYKDHYAGIGKRLKKRAIENCLLGAKWLSQTEEQLLESNDKTIDPGSYKKLQEKISSLAYDKNTGILLEARLKRLNNLQKIEVNQQGLAELKEIILEAEIQLSIDSPESCKQQRMEIQLKQLQQGMGMSQSSSGKKIKIVEILNRWLSTGFIIQFDRKELEVRRIKIFNAIEA